MSVSSLFVAAKCGGGGGGALEFEFFLLLSGCSVGTTRENVVVIAVGLVFCLVGLKVGAILDATDC